MTKVTEECLVLWDTLDRKEKKVNVVLLVKLGDPVSLVEVVREDQKDLMDHPVVII